MTRAPQSTREQHEQELIRAFFLPQRQSRYLELLARPHRRIDVLRELSHFKHLDPRWTTEVPKRLRTALQIADFLQSKGASNLCWAISEDEQFDGKEMVLSEAIEFIFGYGIGTFLSCVPGRLAYFEDEDERWILERAEKR